MLSLFDIRNILQNNNVNAITDDFKICDSWVEYEENDEKTLDEKVLKYMCFEIETIDPETGKKHNFYKAIKFLRIRRLPKNAKQSTAFMDMQTQIMSGVYEGGYNLITIIANMIKPVPLGLLFLYGVQGTGSNIDDAKSNADKDFLGLIGMLQGTFRVLEMNYLKSEETEWLREKMYKMEYMTVVRGIPKASRTGEDAGNKGMGGKNLNPDSEGTLEELIIGMADYEYIVQVIATPVYMDTLKRWSLKTQQDMTDWNEQLQGQKSLSFNLSIPMMYAANAGTSQGWNQGFSDSHSVSESLGESYNVSTGESMGTSFSESFGNTVGHTTGTSISNSISESISESLSSSHSVSTNEALGTSSGVSLGHNVGTNMGYNIGNSSGTSIGTNTGQSLSMNQGVSTNASFSQGQNMSHSFGENVGHNSSVSSSTSYNKSESFNEGLSHNLGTSTNEGYSTGESYNTGSNWGTSHGTSEGSSVSDSFGTNEGQNSSTSLGNNFSTSHNVSTGDSLTTGNNEGTSYTEGTSSNKGGSFNIFGAGGNIGGGESESDTSSNGTSFSESNSTNVSDGYSKGESYNYSNGYSSGTNESHSSSTNVGTNDSFSKGGNTSYGTNFSQSSSKGTSESYGTSSSHGISESFGTSYGISQGQSYGQSTTDSWGTNIGYSTSQGTSQGISQGLSQGTSTSTNVGTSAGQSFGSSAGDSYGSNMGTSQSVSTGESYGITSGTSKGVTTGQSYGTSTSDSVSTSTTTSNGTNYGTNSSVSTGTNKSTGTNVGTSSSMGTSGTVSSGMSSSMGLGPSIGYSKSHQWLDQQVKDILELLEYQNERLKSALRGQGAFYTYVYIGCPSLDALATAQAVAKSTWQNESAKICPLQVMDLSTEEQKHLLYHFSAFSSDITKEVVGGVSTYRYSTVLLPDEIVAFTHLPRVSEGGVWSDVSDIPKFAVPSMLKGGIYMGTVLSAEHYTMKNGYHTQFDYRINENELMHGFFTGASRSGKTVAAMRFVSELSKIRRKKTGKRLRIVCMDPKQDWRMLARQVEPERFNFYSLGNVNFRPIKLNPWKIPKGVFPQLWIDGVIDIYCRAYGLLERGKQMMGETIYALYEEAGVFAACDKEDWRETVPELSKKVNFASIYKKMFDIKASLEGPNPKGGKAGNDTRDAYARLLDRLQAFDREFSIEHRLFGTSEGMGVDDLIGDDDVTVLESKGLEATFKNFIFGVITSGFYKYALAHEGGYLAPDQYETVLILEEANEILTGNDCAGTGGGDNLGMSGQSEFEQMLDQAAGYGLFVFAITQKISDMPSSIIANSGLKFIGKIVREKDVAVSIRSIGREERYEDRDILKWFPRSPIGWFVCQSSRGYDFKDAEPVLVHIAQLNTKNPSNAELEEILTLKKAKKFAIENETS